GRLKWKDVVAPAMKLARDGYALDVAMTKALNKVLNDPKSTNAEFRRVYSNATGPWQVGETLKLPDLAKTLQGIAEEGPDYFYTGPVADLVDQEMQTLGGLIRKADLAKYKAKERAVIRGAYRGYEIIGAPPPSSGGITLTLA